MRRNVLIVLGLLCYACVSFAQGKRTVLSATIDGYQRDMVYFDCVQTPFIRQEFHANPGEEHVYSFDTDRLVSLIINGRTTVLLMPGDSLHVNLQYQGKQVKSVRFSGGDRAVAGNELYAAVGAFKREIRYKTQLLACAVVDVKPANRIDDSRRLLDKTRQLVGQAKGKVDDDVANYVMAESEGLAYTSFIEYPMMYEETRKLPIAEQGIGDYWSLLKDAKLRDDVASLSCPDYFSFLLLNMAYEKSRQAHEKGSEYKRPDKLEDMFGELASFYDGRRRDVALYSIISNYIQGGKDIERVEPLIRQYKEKYCVDSQHAKIIDSLMQ